MTPDDLQIWSFSPLITFIQLDSCQGKTLHNTVIVEHEKQQQQLLSIAASEIKFYRKSKSYNNKLVKSNQTSKLFGPQLLRYFQMHQKAFRPVLFWFVVIISKLHARILSLKTRRFREISLPTKGYSLIQKPNMLMTLSIKLLMWLIWEPPFNRIPGKLSNSLVNFMTHWGSLQKNKSIYTFCQHGNQLLNQGLTTPYLSQ